MTITLTLGDFLMIAAIILILTRSPFGSTTGPARADLRMQRQIDAIMAHLGLPEPVVSAPGALSPPVLALLHAGKKIEAILLYRQETGADIKAARKAVDQGMPTAGPGA